MGLNQIISTASQPIIEKHYFSTFDNDMKVLVTGSSGKLGSVTVQLLRDFGHQVIGADIPYSATTHTIADVKITNKFWKSRKV